MTNIHFSPLPDVEIPDSTVTDYVFRNAGTHPDHVAMIDGVTGSNHTFAELTTAIRALAGGLTARGLEVGAIVALMAPNMPEFAIVFHGAAVAGLATTTLNPTYTAEEIRHQLIDSGAVLLFTIEALAPLATEAIEGTAVTDVIFLDKAEGAQRLGG
ncbi:MAG TPA: 4-coumarate--CoA ligase family protein, partial [Gemmatimonadetes bacterium]|nr:4-coumarate--CoA ligase family protein [Gemmatimonadota bacterium]